MYIFKDALLCDHIKEELNSLLVEDEKIKKIGSFEEIISFLKSEKKLPTNFEININAINSKKLNNDSENFLNTLGLEEFGITIIDCKNLVLMPSFADLHAHFRTPGYEYKEDLLSGSKSAVRGGYTFVNLMANTKPVCSSMEIFDFVMDKIKEIDLINAHQTISLTRNFEGKDLSHIEELDPDKVIFISEDGKGVMSNLISMQSLEIAKKYGYTIMTHSEDMDITPISYRVSENIMTFRDLYLSKVTGGRLHLSHVSTKEAVDAIRYAKSIDTPVTAEVSPHHISLWDNDFKVNPPIRKKNDVDALIDAIRDGTIDAIATDHAPHSKEDKEKGSPGMPGLETSFALCYTNLVKNGKISLSKLSSLMSYNPYKIIGEKYSLRGDLKEDFISDLTLVDIEKSWMIKGEDFASKGKITPFEGREVFGKVILTMKKGKVVYS